MIFIYLQSFILYITAQDHINTIGTKNAQYNRYSCMDGTQ